MNCFRLLVTHAAWASQALSCVLLDVIVKKKKKIVFEKVEMDAIILLS